MKGAAMTSPSPFMAAVSPSRRSRPNFHADRRTPIPSAVTNDVLDLNGSNSRLESPPTSSRIKAYPPRAGSSGARFGSYSGSSRLPARRHLIVEKLLRTARCGRSDTIVRDLTTCG